MSRDAIGRERECPECHVGAMRGKLIHLYTCSRGAAQRDFQAGETLTAERGDATLRAKLTEAQALLERARLALDEIRNQRVPTPGGGVGTSYELAEDITAFLRGER